MTTDITFLKKHSMKLETNMSILNCYGFMCFLHLGNLAINFDKCYTINNSIIGYCIDKKLFVSPFTNQIFSILKDLNFKDKKFKVPFSEGELPENEYDKKIWSNLLKEAQLTNLIYFEKECQGFCLNNDIQKVPITIIRNSIHIPAIGIKVTHPQFEATYYPLISNTILDFSNIQLLGTFNNKNDIVIFVDTNGRTYLTKGCEIVENLLSLGFTKRKDFIVPLSNGEELVSIDQQEFWSLN